LRPPAEPPAAHSDCIEDGVVVLTTSQLPSACCVTSPPLEETWDDPADLPSSLIVIVSPTCTDEGRCAVVVKVTGLEQLRVDGLKEMLLDVELMFI
jgi:hypothetical protein